jgi:hypothetical protein
MKPRRPWTEADDAHLRRFHAEGWKDGDIAYIVGREVGAIRRRRWRLGLPGMGKPGPAPGFKMSPEASAKLSERNRRSWQDPEYRAKLLPLLAAHRDAANQRRFRRPDKTTPEGKIYRKIADELGARVAREHMKGTNLGQ